MSFAHGGSYKICMKASVQVNRIICEISKLKTLIAAKIHRFFKSQCIVAGVLSLILICFSFYRADIKYYSDETVYFIVFSYW